MEAVPTRSVVRFSRKLSRYPTSCARCSNGARSREKGVAMGQKAVDPDRDTIVVPVIEEELQVEKRKIETCRLRVTKAVREREEISVQRRPINRVVDSPPVV